MVLGYVIVAAFAVCYLVCIFVGWTSNRRRFFVFYAATWALMVLEVAFVHHDAFVFFVYIGVLTVAGVLCRAPLIVAVMVVTTVFVLVVVKFWGGSPDVSMVIVVLFVLLAMYGFFSIMQSNVALAAARVEVARLVVENERSRIVCDLHDLLGHSLTTVIVKAGLAR